MSMKQKRHLVSLNLYMYGTGYLGNRLSHTVPQVTCIMDCPILALRGARIMDRSVLPST